MDFKIELPEIPPADIKFYINRSYFHELLKYKIIRLAYNSGYIPIPEANTSRGKLDVLWWKNNSDMVAFEIDFSYKKRSLDKLTHSLAKEKYWIIVNKKLPLKQFSGIKIIKLDFNYKSSTKIK